MAVTRGSAVGVEERDLAEDVSGAEDVERGVAARVAGGDDLELAGRDGKEGVRGVASLEDHVPGRHPLASRAHPAMRCMSASPRPESSGIAARTP